MGFGSGMQKPCRSRVRLLNAWGWTAQPTCAIIGQGHVDMQEYTSTWTTWPKTKFWPQARPTDVGSGIRKPCRSRARLSAARAKPHSRNLISDHEFWFWGYTIKLEAMPGSSHQDILPTNPRLQSRKLIFSHGFRFWGCHRLEIAQSLSAVETVVIILVSLPFRPPASLTKQ